MRGRLRAKYSEKCNFYHKTANFKDHFIMIFFIFTILITIILSTKYAFAEINYTYPKQYETLTEGKNLNLKIDYTYSQASVFWLINNNIIDYNNNKKELFFNTTEYILNHPEINFDDQETDVKITAKVIDSENPFNSDNFTWEFFVEPLNFSFNTDKDEYFIGQSILLHLNVVKETKLDIKIFDSNNNLVFTYPPVTVEDITDFLIDCPDSPGKYHIKIKARYFEYSKEMKKTITVTENTQMSLIDKFIKISALPQNPTINDSVSFEAVMQNYDNLKFEWDFNLDNKFDAAGKKVEHIFSSSQNHIITLKITDLKTGEELVEHKNVFVSKENNLVKLTIKDFFTKNYISNAKIIINNQEYTTDSNGEALITLPSGTYRTKIVHQGYEDFSGFLKIEANYFQTIYLYKSDELKQAIKDDKTKPTIKLISPKQGEVQQDLLTTFEFNASDDIYLDECALYIKPKNAVDWQQKIIRKNLGPETSQKITVDLDFNTYLYKVICKDRKNNQQASETYEFSISQYATKRMYQDDIKNINKFINLIDDYITNPRRKDSLSIDLYKIYSVDKKLVQLATKARKIKDEFSELLMNKESPKKINEKLNEINQIMEESKQNTIKDIKIIEKKQFLRSSTKKRIKKVINDLYQNLFDNKTLEQLANNIYKKQDNLQIITKIIKVKLEYLNNNTKTQIIVINTFSRKNLNKDSLIYQLIPKELTTDPKTIEINKDYEEITKSTQNNIIVTIIPDKTEGDAIYFINDNSNLDNIMSLETILIDYADKTESIKEITKKTNDISSLPEDKKPNILNNLDKKKKKSLENIQAKVIEEPTSLPKTKEDFIPYTVLSIILGIIVTTGFILTKKQKEPDELELIEQEIKEIQKRIENKIKMLELQEKVFINNVSNNKDEKKIIEEVAEKIEETKQENRQKEENKDLKNNNQQNIKKTHEEKSDIKTDIDKRLIDFGNKISELKKDLF